MGVSEQQWTVAKLVTEVMADVVGSVPEEDTHSTAAIVQLSVCGEVRCDLCGD